ncbi:hypothetical protein SteCoe_32170 [Stentor coeruleus]|uniref:WW domain-containing protein n=1 Tax=Stentor coeruleus TaxID=5963 RepID=A0A1R2AZP0_9CILI|nr:hypothetical protein SteCoe_32170 [Stentor coeruleus]
MNYLKMEESIVLEEDIDPNYVPTEEEFLEYAESLGLELPEDNDLLYLAREGLKARLPKEWKPCQARDEQIFYFNFETGESVWEHPCDTLYRKKAKEAKDAKKLRQDKSKIKPLQHSKKANNPLSISPVLEQAAENPEFNKRKKELEEEFNKFSEQLKKEYADKKTEQKRSFENEIEEAKEKLKKASQEKDELNMKTIKTKLEQARSNLKRQFDKDEQDALNRLNKEFQGKIDELNNSYYKRVEESKLMIVQVVQNETEELSANAKKNMITELDMMKKELQFYKQGVETEIQLKNSLTQKHISKLSELKNLYQENFEKEKKVIEKDTERQLKSIRQEENGELSIEDRALLYNLEKELSSNLNKELQVIHSENLVRITREKEKIVEQNRNKQERLRADNETRLKEDLISAESELKLQLTEALREARIRKEAEIAKELKEYEEKILKQVENEEQQAEIRKKTINMRDDEKKTELDSKIRGLQREIANLDHQIYIQSSELVKLKDEEAKLRTEIQRAEIEAEDLIGHEGIIEGVVIADLEKQLEEKEGELQIISNPENDRIGYLEKEVHELKKIIIQQPQDRDEIEKMRLALLAEKEELKKIQSHLKLDREKWNREMHDYKSNPSDRKRSELYNIKRIIEKNIQKHNTRVKELKQAEEMLKFNNYNPEASEDEELVLEIWRNAECRPTQTVQYTRQPWQNHNLHVYQRQVNKWCKSREYMKDVMTRHGSWLNNMKEQLNRVMSTPYTFKTFH